MNLRFDNKKITGILTVLPKNEIKFEDEMAHYNFTPAKSLKLKMAMGYNSTRKVGAEVCVSDLCEYGLNFLIDNNLIVKEDIDAIILVTQSPDFIMPPTSNVIHGRLGLRQDVICMDINQGCAGYLLGLFQAFMLCDQPEINKVVLLNADVLSRKVSTKDRNSNPLIGDGASVTIVEKSTELSTLYASVKMEGAACDAIMIPAGGFRIPSTNETSRMTEDGIGNFRALDNLVMKGDAVFNFVQSEVPPMIEQLLIKANLTKEDVDFYMFHQPNKFMLNKLADKLGIPREKMPSNIVENFGNSSGVTIPTVICYNLGEKLTHETHKMCLAGFGVGLSWAALVIDLGELNFCNIIEY